MPSFHLQDIHFQLPCGRTLFTDLNWHHHHHRSALIGRNGVGKSLLAQIITGKQSPSLGCVSQPKSLGYFAQNHKLINAQRTIADYLGVEKAFVALERVAQGAIEQHWFDTIAERWQLHEEIRGLLSCLHLPCDPYLKLYELSGGQLATLMLWRLFDQFNHADSLLILDEPSNHLDQRGKAWLVEQMHCFKGAILIISHDQVLLDKTAHIYELDSLGLHHYCGNYRAYLQQKNAEQQALERQLNHTRREHQCRLDTALQAKQKAAQRARQGQKSVHQGSQPKVTQDFKKNKAGSQLSRAATLTQGRLLALKRQEQTLKSRQATQEQNRLYIHECADSAPKRIVLNLFKCQLPFGQAEPITMCVRTGQKWHIQGDNGAGKSTLFKVIQGVIQPVMGDVLCQHEVMYLDQHASMLQPHLSVLEQCRDACENIHLSQMRTLLAGIGLRGDTVQQKVATLSGGQKMKLAMLMVSHQVASPLLLLDEPDNHLDLVAKQQLAELLNDYSGTFLLISHDEEFVKACGVTERLKL